MCKTAAPGTPWVPVAPHHPLGTSLRNLSIISLLSGANFGSARMLYTLLRCLKSFEREAYSVPLCSRFDVGRLHFALLRRAPRSSWRPAANAFARNLRASKTPRIVGRL